MDAFKTLEQVKRARGFTTDRQLAACLGVSAMLVCMIRSGKRNISAPLQQRINTLLPKEKSE